MKKKISLSARRERRRSLSPLNCRFCRVARRRRVVFPCKLGRKKKGRSSVTIQFRHSLVTQHKSRKRRCLSGVICDGTLRKKKEIKGKEPKRKWKVSYRRSLFWWRFQRNHYLRKGSIMESLLESLVYGERKENGITRVERCSCSLSTLRKEGERGKVFSESLH